MNKTTYTMNKTFTRGHGTITFTLEDGTTLNVGRVRDSKRVIELLDNGDVDGARVFCNSRDVRNGLSRHNDTMTVDACYARLDKLLAKEAELMNQLRALESDIERACSDYEQAESIEHDAKQKEVNARIANAVKNEKRKARDEKRKARDEKRVKSVSKSVSKLGDESKRAMLETLFPNASKEMIDAMLATSADVK